ncbi:related to coatomer delta subunit (delta-coat protein) [Melanopsichium pennsylvanicum]|uniref:Coatomer subunit delta n=2 Tax=Melanopsichium pennsylvanicum TaxID=63383 RepID=A0AAJ4XGL5_9BASI|nr:related to coatomer delta subunit (delta-coat protein) [Melanopsichium pennsylvanicum 4]SNX82149.1 related to coatomer delta subunit (delta-coat protein) [Melanopsichium pennsylvanicum]
MVILAASVSTRGGKPVISRQFRDMPRSRIEGLLASFPKLISAGSQHTSVETDAVRFVYQPLEDLYMILITNKNSNILQDIDTLHLFARVTSDICRSLDESSVLRYSFELLGAFDEIISLGYRENVNLTQVRSILEMESHEEKIQEIIERNKEMEAKEELKRRAKQLEMQRRDAARRGQMGANSGGFGSSGGYTAVQQRFEPPPTQAPVQTGFSSTSTPAAKPFKGKGMQLGKKSKGADLLGAMGGDLAAAAAAADVELTAAANAASASLAAATASSSADRVITTASATSAPIDPLDLLDPVHQEPIHVIIKERISISGNRDGGLESLEIKGDLLLKITDPSLAKVRIQLAQPDADNLVLSAGDLQFKTNPQVDKAAWGSDRIIAPRDARKPFPVNQSLGVLRWRMVTKDETALPLSINCWPSPNGQGGCDVSIEYELENEELGELRSVIIAIPLPEGSVPSVECPDGSWAVNEETNNLEWSLESISSANKSGSLEFSVTEGAENVDVFFPVVVDFICEKTLTNVAVADVILTDTSASTTFSQQSVLSAETYVIN